MYPHINQYFSRPTRLISKGNRKNLIMIQVESLELEFVGNYSRTCPGNMKYLSSLTESGFFSDRVIQQKYVDYSAGAMFAAECGLPLLRAQRGSVIGVSPTFSKNLHCLGDYLKLAGYHMEAHNSIDNTIHYYQKILRDRGYQIFDQHVHMHDRNLVGYLINKRFKVLKEMKQPWVVFIETGNTHLHQLFNSTFCKVRMPACPKLHQTFDCVDQLLEVFIKNAKKQGLLDNTIVFIYGDHRHLGSSQSYYGRNFRKMGFWFPFEKPKNVNKNLSIYDIPPTILDMLDIHYSPSFPFGAPVFSDKNGTVPSHNELSALYNFWNEELGLGWNFNMSYDLFNKWSPGYS